MSLGIHNARHLSHASAVLPDINIPNFCIRALRTIIPCDTSDEHLESEVDGLKAVMKLAAGERLPMTPVFTGFIDHCVYVRGAPLQA
jgi:hypothetical protein